MKIISRNVNGIRAVVKKWFLDFVKKEDPDILCIQETKAKENQISEEMHLVMKDYDFVWNSAERPGYAGTAIFYKKNIDVFDIESHFDEIWHFNQDGRVTEIRFKIFNKNNSSLASKWLISKEIVLMNNYFPNGGTRADGTEMLWYKLEYYDHFLKYIQALEKEDKLVITCGDFNVCHKEIDIARPEANKKSIWFLPEERAKVSNILDIGFVDVFRKFNPDLIDHYTWWSYRAGARPKNVWRRLDYFVVSQDLMKNISFVEHMVDVMWSDHCPIWIEFC